ncbi:MAG: malto-oligosyltrehalose synthase [Hyphomicrobiaceae bacterium]
MRATYRLQLRSGVTFQSAAKIVPYLARLGISHLYLSPILEASPGSTHGYDVTDCNRIDPSLGGDEGFAVLTDALARHGLGLVVDIVPNHMAASPHNAWWRDILRWGRESPWARHFDVDWSAPRLLLPVLGKPYAEALADGAFSLEFDRASGEANLAVNGMRLPLCPASYADILAGTAHDDAQRLAREFVQATPGNWPRLRQELAGLACDPAIGTAIDCAFDAVADDREAMHALHENQVWRLANWRGGNEMLTYRRFFEITGLVGLSVERDDVFRDVHAQILRLIADRRITGLRLDHIDGLADPAAYLDKLATVLRQIASQPVTLHVEKILGSGENLPQDWPVAGTTGYELGTAITGLLVDPDGETSMTLAYGAFTGGNVDLAALIDDCKRGIVTLNLASELSGLARMAEAIASGDRAYRDIGPASIHRAIVELAVALPVYRTYVDAAGTTERDRAVISAAVRLAKAGRTLESGAAIDFIEKLLRLDFATAKQQAAALAFTRRFQQTTGPVMAKALEDTAFYRYNRLIALNEVGSEPGQFGLSPDAFHGAMQDRLERQPGGLSATATHDTKRGEDARARICVLSETAGDWARHVAHWHQLNRHLGTDAAGARYPDPDVEWLFYQSLLGAWPQREPAPSDLSCLGDRMAEFMLKAVREAKVRTSWTAPDSMYEEAVERFVLGALDPDTSKVFLADFARVVAPLVVAGALNSLTQTLIKLVAPGVPDIYQGTETWDLSLVDPDNRRSVDFDALEQQLARAQNATMDDLLHEWRVGLPKLFLLSRGLALRRERPHLFAVGTYQPLQVTGPHAHRVMAFARTNDAEAVIAIAPRLSHDLLRDVPLPLIPAERWHSTILRLPGDLGRHRWRNVLVDDDARFVADAGRVDLRMMLARFPVAMLASQEL